MARPIPFNFKRARKVGGNPPTIWEPFTVATAPTASTVPAPVAGDIAYVSNGAAGNPILAFWNGSVWKRSDDYTLTISAT